MCGALCDLRAASNTDRSVDSDLPMAHCVAHTLCVSGSPERAGHTLQHGNMAKVLLRTPRQPTGRSQAMPMC